MRRFGRSQLLLASLMLGLVSPLCWADAGVCRIKIGEEWIPMGASQLSSCLKYAESAASPGERQYATFGDLNFYHLDGQFLRSTDNGRTWQNFKLSNSEGDIGSLNVLRGPDAADASSSASAPRSASPAAGQTTDSVASTAEAIAASALPATDNVYVTPAEPAPRRRRAVPAAQPMPEPEMPRSNAAPIAPDAETRTATQATATTRAARAPQTPVAAAPAPIPLRDCQINAGSGWQNVVTPSLNACSQLLVERMQPYPDRRGHAYWGGRYLLSMRGEVYLSSDGNDWKRMKP